MATVGSCKFFFSRKLPLNWFAGFQRSQHAQIFCDNFLLVAKAAPDLRLINSDFLFGQIEQFA